MVSPVFFNHCDVKDGQVCRGKNQCHLISQKTLLLPEYQLKLAGFHIEQVEIWKIIKYSFQCLFYYNWHFNKMKLPYIVKTDRASLFSVFLVGAAPLDFSQGKSGP